MLNKEEKDKIHREYMSELGKKSVEKRIKKLGAKGFLEFMTRMSHARYGKKKDTR